MDYLDQDSSDRPDISVDQEGSGLTGVEDVLQELEEGREKEEQILEDQIEDVESEIEKIQDVYEDNASKLWESIEGQSKKLEIAERSAGEDEKQVRDRLAQLYRELRRERREEVENRLELKMRKWDLERELDELEGLDGSASNEL